MDNIKTLRAQRFLPLALLLLIVLGGFVLIAGRQYQAAKLTESLWRYESRARNKNTATTAILLDLSRISNYSHQAIITKTTEKQRPFVDAILLIISRLNRSLDAIANGKLADIPIPAEFGASAHSMQKITSSAGAATKQARLLGNMMPRLSGVSRSIIDQTRERNLILSGQGSGDIRHVELTLRQFVHRLDDLLRDMTEQALSLNRATEAELTAIKERIALLQRRTQRFLIVWGSLVCLAVMLLIAVVYRQILNSRLGLEATIGLLRQTEEELREANQQVQSLNASLENMIRKRTRQLEISEKQWRDAFDAVQSPMLIYDGKGLVVKANEAYLQTVGKATSEVAEQPFWQIFPKSLGPFFCVPHFSPHGIEIEEMGRIYQLRFYDFKDPQAEAAYTLLMVDDVTDQRESVDRLMKYKQIISTDKNLIAFINHDHTYLAANDLYARSFGCEVSSIIGRPVCDVVGHAFYHAEVRERFDRCLGGSEVQAEIWRELPHKGRRLMEASLIPFVDKAGHVTGLVSRAVDVTDIREAHRLLEFQAHHHPLTRLPNRVMLHKRLQTSIARATRRNSTGAILYLDLDNFKHVNDSLGHTAGDALLTELAGRLTDSRCMPDTVAHLGGDEFVILIDDLPSPETASEEAQQLLQLLKKPFFYEGTELFIGASIGISLYPDDSCEVEVLLKNADAALHKAKELGKNQCYRFAPELTRAAVERVALEGHLQRALEKNELVVYYQPQIRLADRQVIACEALVRWKHPKLGMLPPDRFIPLAEETGLIVPFGDWILREACRQLVAWRNRGFVLERVAINLSGRQIQQKNLVSMVKQALQDTGCPPEAVELEITEGFIMRHPEQAIELLQRLRAIGVKLSVDDFGTGHSSLSYLKRLPINRLKIDRSFVKDIGRDPNDEAIVTAIIALGTSLGLEITAEGIETEEHLRYLAQKGCHEGQGFLISRPSTAHQCESLLRRST